MNADLIPDLTTKAPQRPWHDHRAWTAELATTRQHEVLYRWVASAGGFIEGLTASLPALPPGPARTALADALATLGIATRVGAPAPPDFGRELRMREVGPTARLVVRFQMEALADRGSERIVTGRVNEGGTFALTVLATQPAAELVALHRGQRSGLRVEGVMCPQAFKRRDAAVVPIRGVILGAVA